MEANPDRTSQARRTRRDHANRRAEGRQLSAPGGRQSRRVHLGCARSPARRWATCLRWHHGDQRRRRQCRRARRRFGARRPGGSKECPEELLAENVPNGVLQHHRTNRAHTEGLGRPSGSKVRILYFADKAEAHDRRGVRRAAERGPNFGSSGQRQIAPASLKGGEHGSL